MTIDHLQVTYTPTAMQKFYLQGPAIPQLYQVKWDHEISDADAHNYGITSFTDRLNARPMIFRVEPFNKTLLTERLQWLWKSEIDIEGAGLGKETLLQVWRWMTSHDRAYTNGVGCDILRDYILRLRLTLGLPGIYPLLTGGAVVAGNETTYQGIRQLELDHIGEDGQVPGVDAKFVGGASAISHRSHPWLIHYTVNSTKTKLTDDPSLPYGFSYLVNPWTTEIWQGRNAPVPFIAREAVYYPLELLKKLPLGNLPPSPYNPPRP
jgi:hypothetical protein